jgi:hypothetical protein
MLKSMYVEAVGACSENKIVFPFEYLHKGKRTKWDHIGRNVTQEAEWMQSWLERGLS